MEKLPFRIQFFRLYDRKIADGTITFSQTGIRKNDFTRLCTETDFILDRETVERLCTVMKLTEEESRALMESAGYEQDTETGAEPGRVQGMGADTEG